MDTEIELDLEALRSKLAAAVSEDTKQLATLQARIEKNRALLGHIRSSLNAYRPSNGGAVGEMSKRGQVLEAISSLTKSPFTAEDVITEVNRLFPDARINRPLVSSIMWKTLESGKAKTFRQMTKGVGRKPSLYEKIDGIRDRTRATTANELPLPPNGQQTSQGGNRR